ncbi:MAG: alpha/beta hydrolase [Cyanobacteria bacterium J06631_9]
MTRLTPAPPNPLDPQRQPRLRSRLNPRFNRRAKRYLRRFAWGCGVGLIQLALALSPTATKPSPAAEKITFSLGATVERSISVESLEIYVNEGRVTKELKPYIDYIERIDPDATTQIRELLTQRADLDVVTVAQFAYTPQGEYLLTQAGEIFRTGARLSGQKGLRSAAILSAADTQTGLTLLNVIQKFPTPVLRVDIRRGLSVVNQVGEAFERSDAALAVIQQIALENATKEFPNGTTPGELTALATQPGIYSVRRFSLNLKSSVKPVDVYVPQVSAFGTFESSKGIWPTVIISHGLGNDRRTFTYLSMFLAAHGYAVVNLEHRGSSAEQINALVSARTNEVVSDDDFINRPLLVSDVLDELAQTSVLKDQTIGTIDFNNVGVIGQSFGGYTALAVAGAPVNLDLLRAECPPSFSINISLLLQCQAAAVGLPSDSTLDFYDPRIKGAIAINPITSKIFGQESLSQIQTPLLIMSSSRDTVTPSLPEQVLPFTWLTMPERYLLIMEGATHFSTIGISGNETFALPQTLLGPVPEIAQRYTQVMSLAFLNTHLKEDSRYQSILTSAFTNRFSQPEMPMTIISELSTQQLADNIDMSAVVEASIELGETDIQQTEQTLTLVKEALESTEPIEKADPIDRTR